MARQYWIETLGCPKNQVDSDKLVGTLAAEGLEPADDPSQADLVVVNTCAFVEQARQESVDTILSLREVALPTAEVVVTGCLAERYGDELGQAMPEIDRVAPFGHAVGLSAAPPDGPAAGHPGAGVAVALSPTRHSTKDRTRDRQSEQALSFDLLELPRPAATAPWAYVKVAEGCDRKCGFCAIPSFRGPQRSRTMPSILAEVDALGVQEVVLVAQDLAAFGRDQGRGERNIVPLVREVSQRVPWVRLLYLYPSDLTDELVDAICATGVPYFDLSLQHVSRPLLRGMRRWGDGAAFASRIADIRAREPEAAFRSNFIVGYPGETESDHDRLLDFVEEVRLDWCGFFPYSEEEGTHGADLEPKVPDGLRQDRLAELTELQDRITAEKRDAVVGSRRRVLIDRPGIGRSWAEAPEIDGIIRVPENAAPGSFVEVTVVAAEGPDLVAELSTEVGTDLGTDLSAGPGTGLERATGATAGNDGETR